MHVFTRSGKGPLDLVAKIQPNGEYTVVAPVGMERRKRSLKVALLLSIFPAFLLPMATASTGVWLLGMLGSVTLVYSLLNYLLIRKSAVPPDKRRGVARFQELLKTKAGLEGARSKILAQGLVHFLRDSAVETLIAKMDALDTEMYANRIATMERARGLIQRQIDVRRQLEAKYSKAIGMIDIELDTWALDVTLASEDVLDIDEKVTELKALQESLSDLEAQLIANDEVQQLLS